MDYLFNLLTETEYCVPLDIKSRLAKLTLKKKTQLRQSLESDLKSKLGSPVSKRISKDILNEVLTDDSSESEDEEINKIFRTNSSNSSKNEVDKLKNAAYQRLSILMDEIEKPDSDETCCSLIEKNEQFDQVKKITNMTDNMEMLQFSMEEEKINDTVSKEHLTLDSLSQKVSNLGINSPKNRLVQQTSPEKTQLISIESERKSLGKINSSNDFPVLRFESESFNKYRNSNNCKSSEKINLKMGKSTENIILTISSSSLENSDIESIMDSEKNSNMEGENVIVVSDSDDSFDLGQLPKKKSDIINYSGEVSSINPSGQTYLAKTMSNDKADRIETYLSTLPPIREHNTPSSIIQNINNSQAESTQTKSSSLLGNINRISGIDSSDKVQRLNAFLDDLPKAGEEKSSFYDNDDIRESFVTESVENSINDNIPEESVEISETSTENESKENIFTKSENNVIESSAIVETPVQNSIIEAECKNSRYEKTSPVIDNTNTKTNKDNDTNSSVLQTENSSSSYECEEISINAKFNIKIQINSNQPHFVFNKNYEFKDSKNKNTGNKSKEPSSSAKQTCDTKEPQNSEIFHENQKGITHLSAIETITESQNNIDSIDNIDEKAKEILTKLYGNQWQTPENIKKLDRTLNSTNKNGNKESHVRRKIFNDNKDDKFERKNQNRKENLPDKNISMNISELKHNNDESSIGDFSIFHKNVRYNLESTRLNFDDKPKQEKPVKFSDFKVPVSEKREPKTKQRLAITKSKTDVQKPKCTRAGRRIKPIQWNKLNSDDSSIGDDTEADATYQEDISNIKNKSTSSNSSISSDGSYTKHATSKTKKISRRRKPKKLEKSNSDDEIVYLDLSNDVVKVQEEYKSPANINDARVNEKLNSLLKTCVYQPKKQLEFTPSASNTKRKLFTPRFGDEDENLPLDSPLKNLQDTSNEIKLKVPLSSIFGNPINKKLESVKTGTPIFKIPTPKPKYDSPNSKKEQIQKGEQSSPLTPKNVKIPRTPKSQKANKNLIEEDIPEYTPVNKYGFLKSLDVMVPKSRCHPDALIYRDNYKSRKEELAERLYKLYNEKLFKNELDVEITWNKKLINTAGRCRNKKKGNVRSSVVELSEKVLTSADRLRCTLIHELCHAATWIFNGEHGHGATWKSWAQKANFVFCEIPKIGICHSYDIEFKYTYKCSLCEAKSHAHSKSKKVENIRCAYCHGAIEIFINKKDKEGNIVSTPVKEASGFAKFVKENYKSVQKPELKHTEIMKLLSNKFASLKVAAEK